MAEIHSRDMSGFKALLPAEAVVVEAIGYENWEDSLMQEEEASVRQFVSKRRREFAAGRNCARRALQALGFMPQSIGVGTGREPLFPIGTSGTITHTGDYCAAAVIRCGETLTIGIDAEIAEPLDASIVKLVLLHDEQQMLASMLTHAWFPDKLVFSIKEAFFKAYFQRTGCYLDFLDARVQLNPAHNAFAIKILRKDVADYFCDRAFIGHYAYDHRRVYSAIALPRVLAQSTESAV